MAHSTHFAFFGGKLRVGGVELNAFDGDAGPKKKQLIGTMFHDPPVLETIDSLQRVANRWSPD